MLYIGIDPGPEFCGLVVYQVQDDCSGVVIAARSNATVQEVRAVIDELVADTPDRLPGRSFTLRSLWVACWSTPSSKD